MAIPSSKIVDPEQEVEKPITQEEFLAEHNKLSPARLRATGALLARFRQEKQSLFKTDGWSLEKLRRPLIIWLTSLPEYRKDNGEIMVNNQKYEKFS